MTSDIQNKTSQDKTKPRVVAVHRSVTHAFSKRAERRITLLAGLGIEGDAHCGATVKHRSRVAADPTQPNLRQVHLIAAELFDELRDKGFAIKSGDMGENITTIGIDLLALPEGTLLNIGQHAVLRITGLRNPRAQLDAFKTGLMTAVLDRDRRGGLIRKAGVMSVVVVAGAVSAGDSMRIERPKGEQRKLARV